MAGGIYSDQKCPICGKTMKDNGKSVCCPIHKKQQATQLRVCLRYKGELIRDRCTSYQEAQRLLTGWRYKIDEGTFDPRDYKADNPMGFENLAEKWLEFKKADGIKKKSWNNLNNYAKKAVKEWGNRNIKTIGYAEIEDFLFLSLKDLSSKSRSNASSALHSFWDWLRRRRVLDATQVPDWPEISFELAFRNTVDKTTQNSILDEIYRISYDINPRIWIGIKWLATYFSIRPGEMIEIKEGQIDREKGFLIVTHTKEKKPKVIPLIEEDIELVQSLPKGFPNLHFFRHMTNRKGTKEGTQFAPDYLREWWNRACQNLGIDGVDMYGGTRHSTVIALGEEFTPEELKAASFHSTNKAFERYFRTKPNTIKNIYESSRKDQSKTGNEMGTEKLPLKPTST